jgi:hypothetical protein
MKPVFLPGIEQDTKPSPHRDAVEQMKVASTEYRQIWNLFAFAPHATRHLAAFTQEIMREPAPLTPGFRGLIAAYTPYRNRCPF